MELSPAVWFGYFMGKLGYARIDSNTIKLCMFQETFFSNMRSQLDDESWEVVRPYAEAQAELTKTLRGHQLMTNSIQE